MAKQTSIITLNGNVGGLSFYKTKDGHMAREKGGVSKDRIMNDPKYARTRENLKEFTENIRTVKLVQDTIRPAIIRIADPKLYQRMVRQMMKVLRTDPVNGRGQRVVAEGDWNLLQGFELNSNAILSGTIRTEFTVTNTPTDWTCTVPAFLPADYLVSQSFLVSQATLQRRQQLSVLMTARRGTFTVSYARGQSSRLLNNLTLGDDFDSTSRIKTDTLSFLYAHRLTPVTSANASYAIQRSEGDLDTQRNSQYTLTLGISTQLGRRTSGSVQVRRLHSTSGLNPYSENALVGNILHRF